MRRPLLTLCAALVLAPAARAQDSALHFTVTADMRGKHEAFAEVLEAIRDHPGGAGAFHVGAGDVDGRVWENREVVDQVLGPHVLWFPGIGNHEAEDPVEMDWLRQEYLHGDTRRPALRLATNEDGPAGCVETTYSWDRDVAHLVYLNQYWDGSDEPGADVATDGDVVPELLAWLDANLAASTRPAVFVFGHEPAFPFHRHVGDSLDQYEANRDAFWALLEERGVAAYICGHTHVYSAHRPEGSPVWQVDVGNAGNDSALKDRFTFLDVRVAVDEVRYDVWRNMGDEWHLAYTWSEPLPRLFLDGFESGSLDRWATK